MTSQKEQIAFNAEVSKVLDIMIHSLYTNKDVFLRELVSNASDACEKLRYESLSNQEILEDCPDFSITVEIDRGNNAIIVSDTGIGMNKEDMVSNLGTIAKSGTGEFIKKLSGAKESGKISDLIGQFGVGFYSSFMVAEKVTVQSCKAGEKQVFLWESIGSGDGYYISELESIAPRGTKITLYLKEEFREEYLDKFRLKHILESYSGHISVPVHLKHEDGIDAKSINNKSALWMRDKKDITQEEYVDFFKSIAHLPQEPWAILHNQIEGNFNYSNLLFIPAIKPFDLFHPDRQTRVKLYVKKVFITEENVNLIPKYLRFIYGIIDCPDLPLNISRETLQDSNLLGKIRDLVTKKVLSELKVRQEKNSGEYNKFWENFGQVLKEGLCEPIADRDSLLTLSLFKTTKSNDKYVTLQEYIDKMPPGQREIYYYICETDDAACNPQIEGFTKNSIEVILLTDYVDNFWTTVVNEFKTYEFKSINRSDINISEIANSEGDVVHKTPKITEDNEKMITIFTEALAGLVKNVKISDKLTDSAACLSIEGGAMDIKMEKFLLAQGQVKQASLKTLEINPNNKLVQKACKLLTSANQDAGKNIAITIFEIACIAQDEALQHPNRFAKRLFDMLGE